MVSAGPRDASSAPPQNVAANHARSHRAGSPLRAAASPAGDAARAQSASIDARCALRSRQPIDEPVRASSS